jgi:hypothetical protein
LTVVNLALLAGLFVIFLQQWRKTRAQFSAGLALFAGVLLLRDLLQVFQVLDRASGLPVIGARVTLLLTLGETTALAILLWLVAR